MSRADWLRRPAPRWLGLVILVLAPPALSGPVRALTGWSLPAALAPAISVTLALAAPLLLAAHRPPPGTIDRRLLAACLVFAGTLAAVLLWNRWFGGLMVIVDGDSGTHVSLRDEFAARDPGAYAGFVSFYALTWWIERFGATAFQSFAAGFYIAVLSFTILPLAAAATTCEDIDRGRARLALLAGTAWTLASLYFVSLPLFHYHQAEGFFVHVFGVVPLLLLWLADGWLRTRRLRLVFLLVLLGAYRFGYGFNLGDVSCAIAMLLAIEARRAGWRGASLAAAIAMGVGLLVAGVIAYRRLNAILAIDGWIIEPNLWASLAAQLLLVAVCTAACFARTLRGSGIVRWMRLPAAFGLANAVFFTRLLVYPPPHRYYLAKYNLHAVWLLAAATTVLVAALAARKRTAAALALAIIAAAALALQSWATRMYRPTFLERAFGKPPFRTLMPLSDLRADQRIRQTLARERKQFGGYLVTFYPLMSFMNASLGFYNGGITFYHGGAPRELPGHCVFWEGGAPATWIEGDFPHRHTRARWNADPQKQCVSYPAHWNPPITRTLCWICR